jgi:ABC-type oligopeptide transport system ATPase subunit
VRAVDGVSFDIFAGETLGLVGESGCGKSTVGRCILRLNEPTGGEILFEGENIVALDNKRMQKLRREMQIIFQDPYASLNPATEYFFNRFRAAENSRHRQQNRTKRARCRFAQTSRTSSRIICFAIPHEFSGGQRQRLGIARALALNPKFIIADEPVSALDVSVQAQVVNLLQDLQSEFGLTYLFISHGLAVVEHISQRVAVMYLGENSRDCRIQRTLRKSADALYQSAAVGDSDSRPENKNAPTSS